MSCIQKKILGINNTIKVYTPTFRINKWEQFLLIFLKINIAKSQILNFYDTFFTEKPQ